MLKVYICPLCGSYRFVTSTNYTCYRCSKNMTLADVEYKNYIEMNDEERQIMINKYTELRPQS